MNEIFECFPKHCPIPVALRATLERIFSPEKLDDWFKLNADKQYTKELLFSTIFDLMSLVVFKVFPSVNAACQSKAETIATSISSVYNKLNGLEVLRHTNAGPLPGKSLAKKSPPQIPLIKPYRCIIFRPRTASLLL